MTDDLDIEAVQRALVCTMELEKLCAPKGVFVKRIVFDVEAAKDLADLVVHHRRDGIRFHSSCNWGAGKAKNGQVRVFYPVNWTGDSGDVLKCWYRII